MLLMHQSVFVGVVAGMPLFWAVGHANPRLAFYDWERARWQPSDSRLDGPSAFGVSIITGSLIPVFQPER